MNCLEARRMILADPRSGARGAAAHLEGCPPCGEFAARTVQVDAELAAVLEVPVPTALADRVIAGRFEGAGRRRVLAMAASVALASASAGYWWMERDDPMALAGIEFVISEEASAILAAKAPDARALQAALGALGVSLPRQIGELRYVGTCPFLGMLAHHVVATTPQGKVTLLLLPGKRVGERRHARSRGLAAMVSPAAGGAIALVGDSERSIERVCSMMLET